MRVHKLTVMVIGWNGMDDGAAVAEELELGRFGGRCIRPRVARVESAEIGDPDDVEAGPLNRTDRQLWLPEFERLFRRT